VRLLVVLIVACKSPAPVEPYQRPAQFFPAGVFADPSADDPGDHTAHTWSTILTRLHEPRLDVDELRVTLHRSFDTDLTVRLTRDGLRTLATFSETDVLENGDKRLAARSRRVVGRDWRRVTETFADRMRAVASIVPRCDPVPVAPASTVDDHVDGDALVIEISAAPPTIVTCRMTLDGNWWLVELADARGYHAIIRPTGDRAIDQIAQEVFALARR
jgi:hypothetical protein